MRHLLFPNDEVSSAYVIDFAALAKEGYRGVIFDIDNTLVPHGAPADARAVALFSGLRECGYSCMLISNNREPRVKQFADQVGAAYIYKAGKPKPDHYLRAMVQMGTTTENTIFVGDQIFTDILGANLAGIRTVRVHPVLPWREEIQIIFKRFLEAVVLGCYHIYENFGDTIMRVPILKGEQYEDRDCK